MKKELREFFIFCLGGLVIGILVYLIVVTPDPDEVANKTIDKFVSGQVQETYRQKEEEMLLEINRLSWQEIVKRLEEAGAECIIP